MQSVLKLARGTVRVLISGAEPEKLLNLCAERGIEFFDAEPKRDYALSFSAWASDYPEIVSLAERAMCDVKLVSSRGGRRIGEAVKRRIVFAAGFAVCVILLAVSSLYVWDIEIDGNSTVSDGRIISVLSDCGLEYGTFWPGISSDMLRSRVLLELPELSWLSVNVNNSRARVLVHERVEKPEIIDEKEYADVTASKAGLITRVSALEGKAMCAVGDTVVRGDVLISGRMDSPTAEDRLVHAQGEIEARTWYEKTAVTPLYAAYKTDRGRTEHDISVYFGKNRINFFSDSRNISDSCDKITKYKSAALDKVFALPIGISSEKTQERYLSVCRIDTAEALARMKQTLLDELKADIGGGTIEEYSFTVSGDGEKLFVTLRAQCLEIISEELYR